MNNLKGHSARAKRAVKHSTKHMSVTEKARMGGDVGKHNNATTGFGAVEKNAMKEGYSPKVAQKIAGAEFQKMRRAGKL